MTLSLEFGCICAPTLCRTDSIGGGGGPPPARPSKSHKQFFASSQLNERPRIGMAASALLSAGITW
jgi:hypothetical protein